MVFLVSNGRTRRKVKYPCFSRKLGPLPGIPFHFPFLETLPFLRQAERWVEDFLDGSRMI